MKKTVMITGASSGIGKASAELFCEKGWNVVATMRSPESSKAALPEPIFQTRLDVTEPASIKSAVSEALARFGSVEVLVNNAGYGLVGPFESAASEQVERVVATNLLGVMNVTRELLPHFRERGNAVIVNVASLGGRVTFPLYSVYNATKWAIEGFTESLQFELEPFQIRVKIVEPGPVKTNFYHRSLDVASRPELSAYESYVARAFPNLQRAGENGASAEAVARTIYRAATDGTRKLRYPVNASMVLALRALLPHRLFQGIIRNAIVKPR